MAIGSKDKKPTAGISRGRKAPTKVPAGSKLGAGARGSAKAPKAPSKDAKLGMGAGKTFGKC